MFTHEHMFFFPPLTQLVCHRECSLEPIILNNRATPVWVAHRADVCHAEGVTGVDTTQVLGREAGFNQRLGSSHICVLVITSYCSGEEDSGVVMLRVAVVGGVVLPLPLAEVTEGHGGV